MLIISFDAVGDDEFTRMLSYPAIRAFAEKAAVFRGVDSLFVSNTYPIHTSVATGVTPEKHKLISNTEPFPKKNPVWNTREENIKARTLWQAANEKGIKTAVVFWPVTAGSKTIRWNMPEVMARPGESQILTSFKAGSVFTQLKLFLRHKKLMNGIKQPYLDNFATACMVDILSEHKPGLAMIHLTSFDTLCHDNGKGSADLSTAFESLNANLSALLKAAGDDRDVLIFSDHSQRNVHTVIEINNILKEAGSFTEVKPWKHSALPRSGRANRCYTFRKSLGSGAYVLR